MASVLKTIIVLLSSYNLKLTIQEPKNTQYVSNLCRYQSEKKQIPNLVSLLPFTRHKYSY
jgi:hypothetical protein